MNNPIISNQRRGYELFFCATSFSFPLERIMGSLLSERLGEKKDKLKQTLIIIINFLFLLKEPNRPK